MFDQKEEKSSEPKKGDLKTPVKPVSAMREVATQEEFEKILGSEKRIVVAYFHAQWCGPCKKLGPMLEKLATERRDILFVKMDIDTVGDNYGVRNGMPMVAIFGGKTAKVLQDTISGYKTTENSSEQDTIAQEYRKSLFAKIAEQQAAMK